MTGLQQVPYKKKKFYYRLSNHHLFFKKLNIKFNSIQPRMTRDFEIIFESNVDRDNAKYIIENIKDSSGKEVFGEIDSRENSLFCTLTYSQEIKDSQIFYYNDIKINLFEYVNFVALKNGMHHKKGKLYFSDKKLKELYGEEVKVEKIRELISSEISIT